ncbi:MAG: hypothetical protein JXX14_18125 [Deltaproteobacteria bacterium]|nr:hypothetical protein [Deltaproteobacteria bacterium]
MHKFAHGFISLLLLLTVPVLAQQNATLQNDMVIGTATNTGRGSRTSGGTYAKLPISNLQNSDTLNFKVTSGSFLYLTVHGLATNGSWNILYRGPVRPLPLGNIFRNQRARFTHLIIQVNGEYANYQRRPCTLDIFKQSPAPANPNLDSPTEKVQKEPTDSPTNGSDLIVGVATNTGNGSRSAGGTYASLALQDLDDADTLNFQVTSGNFSHLTVHGRTAGGIWNILYRGAMKPLPVKNILGSQRSRYTHLVIQVNGEHANYLPRACHLNILKTKKTVSPKPSENLSSPPTASTAINSTSAPPNNAPQVIVPPLDVVAASANSIPTVTMRPTLDFDQSGTQSGTGAQSYVDIRIYFDQVTRAPSVINGEDREKVVFKDENGNIIQNPTPEDLKKGNWILKSTGENANGWLMQRSSHF